MMIDSNNAGGYIHQQFRWLYELILLSHRNTGITGTINYKINLFHTKTELYLMNNLGNFPYTIQ